MPCLIWLKKIQEPISDDKEDLKSMKLFINACLNFYALKYEMFDNVILITATDPGSCIQSLRAFFLRTSIGNFLKLPGLKLNPDFDRVYAFTFFLNKKIVNIFLKALVISFQIL